MIYLFAGNDTDRKRKSLEVFLGSASKRGEVLTFSKNELDHMQVESLIAGGGLFFDKFTVVFSGVFEREEIKSFLISRLGLMEKSSNDFVFVEGTLLKADIDKFKKTRTEVNYFELAKEKKEKFNSFLLANAFVAKDKFALWFNFRQAVELGVGLEELVGVLFWKAKDLLIKGDFRQFSKEYLQDFSSRLSYLLPEARRKNQDDEAILEKFLLEAF